MGSEQLPDVLAGAARKEWSRRQLLGAGAKAAAGVALFPSLSAFLAACSSGQSGSGGSAPLVAQVFPTNLAPDKAALAKFASQYGLTASAITVPSNYFTVTETKFIGGTPPFDCVDYNPGYMKKLIDNHWIVPLEGLPGVDELKQDMYPAALESLTGPDGKLYGLPYYTNVVTLFYNETILTKNGMKPATRWDELYEQAVQLKKNGVASPIAPLWTTDFNIIQQNFVTECITRGMESQFSSSFDPLWDKDPVARDVLNYWKSLKDAKLVPADATTINHHQDAALMAAGQCVYMWYNSYTLKEIVQKKAASTGDIRTAAMPGKGKSFTFTSPTYQTKRHSTKDAWKLTSFQSGKDKNGNYTGPIERVAIANGTLTGYKSLANNPAIAKAWSQWAQPADIASANDQLKNAVGEGSVLNTSWYAQYVTIMVKGLSQFVAGQLSAHDALANTASQVRAIAK